MKEWNPDEAIEIIGSILADNICEDNLSDEDCHKLAKMIVERLEQGPAE